MDNYLLEFYIAKVLHQKDIPFYALIMAAMYKADSVNEARLTCAFPEIRKEFEERSNVPGGFLDSDNIKSEDQENVIAKIFHVIRNMDFEDVH